MDKSCHQFCAQQVNQVLSQHHVTLNGEPAQDTLFYKCQGFDLLEVQEFCVLSALLLLLLASVTQSLLSPDVAN